MAIYKPSELRLFLEQLGIFPKKGLSQNFLIDGNIIRKIITTSGLRRDDCVLEIGPGPGALTQALLDAGAHVAAIEKDTTLAHALKRLAIDTTKLHIYCDDALNFNLDDNWVFSDKQTKIIANLPYHLTTPILVRFVTRRTQFSSITVMVQEEVARRFTAQPNSSEYSSFTIFLRFYADVHYDFHVSRNCFYPVPSVDSAVVTLQLKEPPLSNTDAAAFFKLTRTAFEHRRKMLRSSLKHLFPAHQIEAALQIIGMNTMARPEVLSLEQFLQLYAILTCSPEF